MSFASGCLCGCTWWRSVGTWCWHCVTASALVSSGMGYLSMLSCVFGDFRSFFGQYWLFSVPNYSDRTSINRFFVLARNSNFPRAVRANQCKFKRFECFFDISRLTLFKFSLISLSSSFWFVANFMLDSKLALELMTTMTLLGISWNSSLKIINFRRHPHPQQLSPPTCCP